MLSDVEDSTVILIHLLCHEIDLFIKDNLPNISRENLKAFKQIYYRSSALKDKIEKGKKFTKYFENLDLLLEDLRRISLIMMPIILAASEIMMHEVLHNPIMSN